MDEAPMLRTPSGKRDGTSRSVLFAVAERADPFGRNAFPSIADICYRTGWDRTTVLRCLRRLEDEKLIVRTGVTKEGCTRWDCSMELRRPPGDREEVQREEDAFRSAAAERKRRSRGKAVTHSEGVTGSAVTDLKSVTVTDVESVTGEEVTHSEPVTQADVTHSKRVTGGDVTDFKSGRHALKACDEPDVTDFKSGRHAFNATRTTLEPPRELTTLEPPGSETPPSSESPRAAEQTTIDGGQTPPPPKKRGRSSRPKVERTPEEQADFDAADKIAHWWWDVRCPKLGISVKNTSTFPGFRKDLIAYLTATPPCTKQEVQQALERLQRSWPSTGAFEEAIRALREEAALEATGTEGSNVRRIGGRQAYRNPDDQSVYDQKY